MAGRDREVRWLQAPGGSGTTEEASLLGLGNHLGTLRTETTLGAATSHAASFMRLSCTCSLRGDGGAGHPACIRGA